MPLIRSLETILPEIQAVDSHFVICINVSLSEFYVKQAFLTKSNVTEVMCSD